MMIGGFLSIVVPFAAGLSVTIIVGALLLISGATQIMVVFRSGSVSEHGLQVFIGILGLVAGIYMVFQPVAALATLTLFLAAYFIASGILESIAAFGARPAKGWGMLLFAGIVSLVLGLMIWQQYPLSGAWAVGILVGVKLILVGWTLFVIGGAAKSLVNE